VTKRKRATRATIGKVDLLPDWPDEKRHRTALEKHLRALIALLAKPKTPDDKRAAIESVVEKINARNDRALVIETEHRDATAIDDIGRVFGMRGRDLAGDFRDW
jgi:hypothetical protein